MVITSGGNDSESADARRCALLCGPTGRANTWAMRSACLSGDNAGFVDRSTERGSEFDDVRFSRRLDAVGTGIDTLVSQIPSCNGLDVPQVIQSPVRHSPTSVAFA